MLARPVQFSLRRITCALCERAAKSCNLQQRVGTFSTAHTIQSLTLDTPLTKLVRSFVLFRPTPTPRPSPPIPHARPFLYTYMHVLHLIRSGNLCARISLWLASFLHRKTAGLLDRVIASSCSPSVDVVRLMRGCVFLSTTLFR